MGDLFERFRVIDTDTHVTEPADTWTARVASRFTDQVPTIQNVGGRDVWMIDGTPAGAPGFYSMAGFDGSYPDAPMTYADCPPAAYDAHARLRYMDEEGIHAQVLYPNLGGFGSGRFLSLGDPALMLECVRAYNDFLVDWASADPKRLLPVCALPFWDVEASVAEIERSAKNGHRAILFCSAPEAFGQPPTAHRHWDPIWAAAADLDLSVSFHIGAGDMSDLMQDRAEMGVKSNFARVSALYLLDNTRCIADLTFGGVCHRFPRTKFVSVESGAGWIPSALETFDWQWRNAGVWAEHPEYDLLPSEYFRRQIYGCFWFEQGGLQTALHTLADNLLYETDYPHPTCMAEGPMGAMRPRTYAEQAFDGVSDEVAEKVLQSNAARLYRVELD